jgi:hypothetical protein
MPLRVTKLEQRILTLIAAVIVVGLIGLAVL